MALILFLHGASSSGKSTLARELRKQADRPFLHLSIDHLRDSGAWDRAAYPNWQAARPAFFSGFHRAVAGFAEAGNDLILEHILDTAGWRTELQTLLAGQDLLFVGVQTGLAELQRRETARGDRPQGSAAHDFAQVHRGLSYDITVDGAASVTANATRVLEALKPPRPVSAFFDAG
ncbi:chloramphenicol phosphotransferase CPT family protein [Tritonibacter horizontis]|uniref:Chloramphenicol 3-O phosphotransferase n=1 Tax=Tritonibacter horizontis TaxID=1768241 RepID=A0A132C2T7_9RHOB|nr:AAA family ATPase [Tritonibacter horizontis]KUP94965.1 chloramphenicol 3-O phosphotransferase [Tritonibacter horizontis]